MGLIRFLVVSEQQVEMAPTGSTAEQLWLLGGIALSLTAAGLVALAATRGRHRGP
ncbi:hypothetical protein GCM10010381_43590 [Streptomyces xantholiticus]|nr:hypothetical protein GCM10010381_43590 [Streptomyces xantholiticus]